MAINFPDSPSNGDTQTINGSVYTYNSTTGKWDIDGDNTTNVTVSDTAPSGAVAGDQWFNSTDGSLYVYYNDGSSSQWVGISGPAGSSGEAGGVTSYANKAAIDAVSSPSEGDLAYDTAADQLYIRTTTVWKRVSAGTDESPIITTEPASTHSLNTDGSTSTVTMVAEDPEGFDITYGIAYPTASNALPDQLANATTIDQTTGVYTFDPSTNGDDAGDVKVRLSASDGVNTTTRLCTLSLLFRTPLVGFGSNGTATFSARTTLDTARGPEKAFDNSTSNTDGCWHGLSWDTTNKDWILIDFGSGNTKTVNNYGVAQRKTNGSQSGSDNYRITAWKLQGSNDNSTFTDLHSLIEEGNDFLRKDVTLLTSTLNTQPNYLDNFVITDLSGNTTAYRYYRLWIDDASGYAIVGEMFMEGY